MTLHLLSRELSPGLLLILSHVIPGALEEAGCEDINVSLRTGLSVARQCRKILTDFSDSLQVGAHLLNGGDRILSEYDPAVAGTRSTRNRRLNVALLRRGLSENIISIHLLHPLDRLLRGDSAAGQLVQRGAVDGDVEVGLTAAAGAGTSHTGTSHAGTVHAGVVHAKVVHAGGIGVVHAGLAPDHSMWSAG